MTTIASTGTRKGGAPKVTAVVLGWNHSEDTLECIASLKETTGAPLHILYVDNGSTEDEVRRVLDGAPGVSVIRHEHNVGVSRGFNAGLAYALRHGADFIFMANNDTLMDPDSLRLLLDAATRYPDAGILVPKIYYHEAPEVLWSAGSRFRRFPPAIIMNKTKGPDDGRYDTLGTLEFTTLCTVLLRADALRKSGLMDPNFLFYFEDYDLALRIREGGYTIRLVPEARTRHKVARVTRAGSGSPAFWTTSGRSARIFARRHGARHRWLAGPCLIAYLALRAMAEGGWRGISCFAKGLGEAREMPLRPVPPGDGSETDPVTAMRQVGPA